MPERRGTEKARQRREAAKQGPDKALQEQCGDPRLWEEGFKRFLVNNGCPMTSKAI